MFATLSEDLQYLLLYGIAGITIGTVFTLFGCVCNPRSRRFAKHKSFILPHDGTGSAEPVPDQVPEVPTSGDIMCQSLELASNTTPNSVMRSSVLSIDAPGSVNPVNRALPDIPNGSDLPTDASGDNLASYADIISNSADEVDSIYTTAMQANDNNSSAHAYARIRDNRNRDNDNADRFVDSSTENDTDDYGESRAVVVSSQGPSQVPVSSIITIQSNPGPSSIITSSVATVHHQPHILRLQITNNPMEGPVFHHNHVTPPLLPNPNPSPQQHYQQQQHHHHHHHHHHQQLPLPPDPGQNNQSEISYNTISVREPLAKVLTEPSDVVGDMEHHYNEVEEERLSSFYEEINSGNSSTYYKIINYENRSGPSGLGQSTSGQAGPSTSGVAGASGPSTSGQSTAPNEASTMAMSQTPMGVAFIEPNNGPLYSFVEKKSKRNKLPVVPSSNLYTMVNKAPSGGEHSGMNGHSPKVLERYSPPPPLPPPIPQQSTSGQGPSKAYRNSMFASRPPGSLLEENIYQKIALSDSEKDPGYETVDKDGNDDDGAKMMDYGYEVVNNDECDPAYEIVKPPDPAYETIKNELGDYGGSHTSSHSGGDPNYEIIANPGSDQAYGLGLSVISPPSLPSDQLPPHHPHHQHHHPHNPLPVPQSQRQPSSSLPFYATISHVPGSSNSPNSIPSMSSNIMNTTGRAIHVAGPSGMSNGQLPEHFRSLPSYSPRSGQGSLPPPHMHSILIQNNNNSPATSLIIDENVIIEHL